MTTAKSPAGDLPYEEAIWEWQGRVAKQSWADCAEYSRNAASAERDAAISLTCKTPGAVYTISTSNPPQVISMLVTLPNFIPRLTGEQAAAMEKELHDAAERILSRFFHERAA